MKEEWYWFELFSPVRDIWRLCKSEAWHLSRELVFVYLYRFSDTIFKCILKQCDTCRRSDLL